MHVRQRHFSGRHQKQVPVAGNLEQVRLELRQVAGAGERRRVDHERRLDFGVAVLRRVELQHEVDERARELRAVADQHRKPRRRHLGAPLEVDDPERRTEIPVRLRREVEGPRRATAMDFDVVGAALPHRHALVREVRKVQQPAVAPQLDGLELNAQLLDLLIPRPTGLLDRRSMSRPCLFARATSSPAAFCWRLSPSISGSSRRRRVSSMASSSSSVEKSAPRVASFSRTASGLSRRNAGSITTQV